uniref:Tyrosine-protein phosphatase domain-containing protein n=1 Tax=Panagrolaimus sp. ES5 TaxID=591445 RepID=A0AC34FC66_9BILA
MKLLFFKVDSKDGKNNGTQTSEQQRLKQLLLKDSKAFTAEWNNLATDKEFTTLPCDTWNRNKDDPKYRYADVVCLDNNIVKIPGCDYFNGPTEDAVEDFWNVVLKEKIPTVVMLCGVFEKGLNKTTGKHGPIPKCAKYWPSNEPYYYDKFEKNVKEILFNDGKEVLAITSLHIVAKKIKKGMQKGTHLQFKNLNDFGVPNSTEAMMDVYQKFVKPRIREATF